MGILLRRDLGAPDATWRFYEILLFETQHQNWFVANAYFTIYTLWQAISYQPKSTSQVPDSGFSWSIFTYIAGSPRSFPTIWEGPEELDQRVQVTEN